MHGETVKITDTFNGNIIFENVVYLWTKNNTEDMYVVCLVMNTNR